MSGKEDPNSSRRLHRSDPVRTGPIRNFANLYTTPQTPQVHDPGTANDASAPDPAASMTNDPLSWGVRTAYQVIERYISAGQRAAEQLNSQPYVPRSSTDGWQDLLQQMLRYQGELLPQWVEMMSNLMRTESRSSSTNPMHNGHVPNGAALGAVATVSLELVCKCKVEAALEMFHSGIAASKLATAGLHPLEPGRPPLTDIQLLPDESGKWTKLRIVIPDRQPPGRYSGLIAERETGAISATISVRIEG